MEFLSQLWLPILLSAVFVFVASSILHMVLPLHRGDYKKMPGEDAVREAIRAQGVQPGQYMFPCPGSMAEMNTPEMKAQFEQGPVGLMVLKPPGPMTMGKPLLQWFLYSLLIGLFVAYVAWHGLGAGAGYKPVFQVAGAAAVMAYAFGSIPESIWKGVSWNTTAKFVFDGVVYGLLTGGTFGWLWPAAA